MISVCVCVCVCLSRYLLTDRASQCFAVIHENAVTNPEQRGLLEVSHVLLLVREYNDVVVRIDDTDFGWLTG